MKNSPTILDQLQAEERRVFAQWTALTNAICALESGDVEWVPAIAPTTQATRAPRSQKRKAASPAKRRYRYRGMVRGPLMEFARTFSGQFTKQEMAEEVAKRYRRDHHKRVPKKAYIQGIHTALHEGLLYLSDADDQDRTFVCVRK